MLFSPLSKSSPHALPSPDGKYVATVFPGIINVRAVAGLNVVNVIKLGHDFSGPVISFQWSKSSRLLLVADPERIRVVSALDDSFNATVRNHVSAGTKPAVVDFGASDSEICVVAPFGLKFTVFDLKSSRAIEIPNPKVFSALSASTCFSFRPETRHLALLTRSAGKDIVSIHSFPTRELLRSWSPDTVDAQGLAWSPDGRWLAVWDSASQGHRIVFYTPDGHAFRTWAGPTNPQPEDQDFALGPGVKSLQFSADSRYVAIGDFSRSVSVLSVSSVTETLRLRHPKTLAPTETLQVWQEQIGISHAGPAIHTFLRATQPISPAPSSRDSPELLSGCSLIAFDHSSTLVATRLDDCPTALWIWDVQVAELRAVLLFHGNVASISWHPHVSETLLIRCDGDQYDGSAFVWDPLSEGPRFVDFAQRLPAAKTCGKQRVLWLGAPDTDPANSCPSIFFSDTQVFLLAFLGDSDQGPPPWGADGPPSPTFAPPDRRRVESPLELVPAEDESDDYNEVEDTFIHRR